jgi:hypothetical protein
MLTTSDVLSVAIPRERSSGAADGGLAGDSMAEKFGGPERVAAQV